MTSDGDPATDEQIQALVARLSRPRRGGGRVIERAAIMAEGTRSAAILDWITASAWTPEEPGAAAPASGRSGLHGMSSGARAPQAQAPRRYVSPTDDAG